MDTTKDVQSESIKKIDRQLILVDKDLKKKTKRTKEQKPKQKTIDTIYSTSEDCGEEF